MTLRKWNKSFGAILAVMMVLLMLCPVLGAFAQQTGEIHIIVKNEHAAKPVSGISTAVCRIAWIDEDRNYHLTDEFIEAGIPLDQLANDNNAEHAKAIYNYIKTHAIDYQTKTTNSQGEAVFSDLQEGVYVVFGKEKQSVSFSPYIVFLPSKINGQMVHTITSIPKTTDNTDDGGGGGTSYRTINVMKIWDDENDKAGKRPENITVEVYRNGIVYKKAVLNQSNGWKTTFTKLPVSGEYKVLETAVPGYTADYSGSAGKGFVITNRYNKIEEPDHPDIPDKPDKAHLSVKKVWDDNENEAGKRPAGITVQLIQNNTVLKTAVLNENNSWCYTFTELSKSEQYTIQEITPSDYSASYSGSMSEGFTITNQFAEGTTDPGVIPPPDQPGEPETTAIQVKKVWNDDENAAGKRPQSVTVHLIANSSVYQTVQLNAENDWAYSFAELPVDLAYTISEEAVDDYSASYSGSAKDGFAITNTYTEGITEVDPPIEPSFPDEPEVSPEPEPQPDKPADVKPQIPQTGVNLIPVYLLMAVGVLLVILGLIDILRGRDENE